MNHKTDMQAVLLDAMRVISESADEIKAGCAIDDEWPDAEDKAEYNRRVAVLERVRALAGRSAGVPEGWKLVPIEPTMEMVKAGSTSGGLGMDFHEWMGRIKVAWRHMIAAAPAPVSEPEQPSERGKHNFESDKPIPIVTYDDGACVMLSSWAGGAHEAGVFGEIALRFTDAHGVETVRGYVARTSEPPNAPDYTDCCDTPSLCSSVRRCTAQDAPRARGAACPHGVDDGACKQCYGEAVRGEQGEAKGVCQRCGGTGECVKDCQDCADSAPAKAEAKCKACNGNDGDAPCAYPEGNPDCLRNASASTLGEPEFSTPTIPFEEAMKYAVQPQATEPKGMTDEQIEKAALDFVKKPGMQGYVEPGDLIDFARALLSKGA